MRNIIWFILLTGIIIFSILFFLLIMDPASAPNYTTTTPATNTPESQITHDKTTTVSPQVTTNEQPAGKTSGGWITFGRYFGFVPLLFMVFPIIKIFNNRKREFLPFYIATLLFVSLASIHGALLIRLVQPFTPSITTGFFLYFISLLFFIRWAVLLFSSQKITGKKIWIPLGILLFFILVHLFW